MNSSEKSRQQKRQHLLWQNRATIGGLFLSRKYTIYTPNCPFALCAGTKKVGETQGV